MATAVSKWPASAKGPPKARTCFFFRRAHDTSSGRHSCASSGGCVWTVGFCAARNLSFYGPLRNSPPQMPSWPSAPGVPRSGTQRAVCDDGTLRPYVRRGHPASPSRVVEAPSVPQSAFRVRPVFLFASKRRRSATPRWSGEGPGRSTSRFVGTLLPSSLRHEKKRGVVPGTRCLPRRMDPPSSRHPGCRRDVATLCRRPRTACSRSLARQQRRRAVRCVVGVGDVSLWDYVVATRASCLSRFEAKRCCGATL